MNKKIVIAILIVVVIACMLVGCSDDKSAIVVENGSFDAISESTGNVLGWKKSTGSTNVTFPRNTVGENGYDPQLGTRYVYIDRDSSTNAGEYVFQTVALKSGKTYKLSATIKVDSITPSEDIGARVGFVEDSQFIGINVSQTTSEWQTFSVYFKVAKSGDYTLYATLGTTTKYVSGQVGFDNINISVADKVDDGVVVSKVKIDKDKDLSNGGSIAFVVLLALAVVAIFGLVYFALKKSMTPTVVDPNGEQLNKLASALSGNFAIFLYVLAGAFAVRFVVLLTTYGYDPMLGQLSSLAKYISETGFLSSMSANTGINQPVGIYYFVAVFAKLADALGIESGSLGYSILLRMPTLIADIVICYMIYSLGQKYSNEKQGAVFASIYAFVPLFFTYGVMYCSWQPVAIALLVATFEAMLQKKYVLTSVLYTLALTLSNYVLLLLPIILVFEIYAIVVDEKHRLSIVVTMLLCLAGFFALSIAPCYSEIAGGNVLYVFKKMFTYFKTKTLLSDNSFNLYAIFGAGNVKARNTLLEVANWLFVITMGGVSAVAYVKKHNRLDLLLLSSAIVTAYAILGAGSAVEILPIALILLIVYLAINPEKRLFGILTGLSLLSFINIAQLLSINGVVSGTQGDTAYSFASNSAFYIVFSVLSVLVTFYYIYVCIDTVAYEVNKPVQPLERPLKEQLKYIFSFAWLKREKK
ncbi:MAG: carbohydrate binding domain-containing protein [Christensenellales bacterium]